MSNAYSGVYAYPQQYFDKAYLADTNGDATTNQTGILSEYGDFFPTQPGQVILTTKPDLATGTTVQCSINVNKMQLDVNHDGTMDTILAGPDNTSAYRPFRFWVNNNYDRSTLDKDDGTNYEDDVLIADCPYTPGQPTRDNNYRDASGRRVIPTKRDLQDFTQFWLAGITTNLLTNLPSGNTIMVSWGDVGSPDTNNPIIDLFAATEADGGMGYLTDETIAIQQTNINLCPYVGRLGPGQSIQLNASTFSNSWAGNHFIWCGEGYGSGALMLTIADASGNVLAQTAAYIQIVDIKQMYERWTVGDSLSAAPTNTARLAGDNFPPGVLPIPFQYGPATDTNTPYILYVHGWNMASWDKDRFAESAFKRLYWQGYQGRFGLFRWPTGYGFTGLGTIATNVNEKDNYDSSEFNAWQSGNGLLNKLEDLNAQYPGRVYLLAHSMGNVVAGEALRLSSSRVVNAYVASQGAISAHTYDTNVPDYSFDVTIAGVPVNFGPNTPNIYGNWFAGNYGGGAGSIVNFYNTNDYALARLHWQLNQLSKPDQNVLEGGTTWTYSYTGSPTDGPPWNNFIKTSSSGTVAFFVTTSISARYEAMSYAAQSYTTALGATPVSALAGSVNLNTVWLGDPTGNDYSGHFWHSAEFRGDNPLQGNYWSTLLGSSAFNIK